MATTTPTRSASGAAEGDQCVVLRGLDWKGYITMLRLRGDRPAPKMIYCDGDLQLVSPSHIHERFAERLGLFVMVVVEECDIPCILAGSTTLRRRKKQAGVEADKAFYLANFALVLGKRDLHMSTDPPPDLAIEAVHTHDTRAALEVYRRLRVPEVWVCDEATLRILVRQANGRYVRSESSVAFPFLKAAEIHEWVTRPGVTSDTAWVKELRAWVRDVLVPRRAGLQG